MLVRGMGLFVNRFVGLELIRPAVACVTVLNKTINVLLIVLLVRDATICTDKIVSFYAQNIDKTQLMEKIC